VKRIKILDFLEALVVSGPAKNTLRFAVDCRDRVEISIATFIRNTETNFTDGSPNEFVSVARSLNIPVDIVREKGPFDVSVLGQLREVIERQNADIVQTHGIKSHLLVSLLPKRFRWIAFHHGYTSENFKMRMYHQFDRWSLRRPDLVVTVCEEFAKRLVRRGVRRERIVVVPNSVKTDGNGFKSVNGTSQRWKKTPGEWTVLAVGRLSAEKGHRYLIDAVSRIVQQSPDLKMQVLIAGKGPADSQLREQVSKSGLNQRVQLVGYWPDVSEMFSIADLFVLPSLSEGSPNVLLESMAAKVPIVATNVGGVPEHVSDGETAILVPPADSASLAAAMTELLSDRTRAARLASAAFDKARLMFSSAKYDERILNVYSRLIGNQFG
jgi:glycosyltransferase involved in cell wall biosynthesis